MFRRKSLPLGVLVMLMVLALVSLGVGYGLWSKTLLIDGHVTTGSLDAVLSVEEVDQMESFNDICPTGGVSIGQDCDQDGFLNDDMEADEKDIAECTAVLSADKQTMTVTITEGYPSFNCFIRYDVENTGSIPFDLFGPDYFYKGVYMGTGGLYTIDEELHVNCYPPNCFEDGQQVDGDGKVYCNLHIHVDQTALEDTPYTFQVKFWARQWNEDGYTAPDWRP